MKQGKAVVADVDMPDGAHVKAFVQIDGETNQVMAVPTPVIGRNLQVLSDELCLGGTELKSIQNGETLTFAVEDEPLTVGIDLKSDTGIRFANGDGEQWRKEGKREWDKYTFGIYGNSGSALDTVALVYFHAHRQHWRWTTIADVIQGMHRKVFYHLMGKTELCKCLIRHFAFFK